MIEPFFFDDHATGDTYLALLKDRLITPLGSLVEGLPELFQKDGASAHFVTKVRDWLNENFPNWIGRCGHME